MAFDRRETALLLIGDFLLLVASLYGALVLRNLELPSLGYFELNLIPFLPMFMISLSVFYIAGLYEKQTRPVRSVMGIRVFGAQAGNVVIAAVLFFILPLTIAPKTILALYLVISVVVISVWRFYRMQRELAVSARTPAVLVGTGSAVEELFEEINENGRYLIRFTACIDTAHKTGVEVAEAIVQARVAGARVIVLDMQDSVVARDLPNLTELLAGGAVMREFSALYEEVFDRVPLAHIGIERMLEAMPRERALYDILKRAFDFSLALVGLVVATPFILLGILARAVTGTPIFFLHARIGRGGRPFTLIKLGSMLLNDHGDPELQKKNRVTKVGKVLRKTRIDELPQLLNILAGDLSFIGPRPELPKIAEVYEREIPYYGMRSLIAPGLSGWAQIHDYDAPRGAADVARTKKKLSFDLYYLKRRSFGLDLAIAIKTVRAILALSGT